MSRNQWGGPKLPAALLDRIGFNGDGGPKSRGFGSRRPMGRKEQRKSMRDQRKQQQRQPRQKYAPARQATEDFDEEDSSSEDDEPEPPRKASKAEEKIQPDTESILRKPSKSRDEKKPSPEFAPAPVSRAMKAKLDEDDDEIARLEKKLGIKGKKKSSKSPNGDGFGDLLDGLDDFADDLSGKRKRSEYDDFLSKKRQRMDDVEEDDTSSEDDEDDFDIGDDEVDEADDNSVSEDSEEDTQDDSEFKGFDAEESYASGDDSDADKDSKDLDGEDEIEEPLPVRKRENPYVAPLPASTAPPSKYIPPSMRGAPSSDAEAMKRLRRQMQGLINRLSEANMLSILKDIENVYANNARQYVTETLIDLLIGLLCDRTSLMDTFIILHAGFASAVYRIIGEHFGAQLLERIVSDFDRFYEAEMKFATGSKETTNLIALLAELYTFQLAGSNLIFDYIKLFLNEMSELNTELLLKVIKNCGSQLRHDDPSSLKDIVILLQKSVTKVGEENLPVRTKFMIETINDLKNNKQKAGAANSVVAAEHTAKMKKTLGLLSSRSKASEPLGVSLADIRSSKKEGKWWLVGASWKNQVQPGRIDGLEDTEEQEVAKSDQKEQIVAGEDAGADILQLAKEQRMNTDIRRAIFANIMSASDYKDAHARLLKLKLKKAQELEIPRVLLHCAGAEQSHNPYYTLIAKRLCTEHRFKWAIQYGLWDLFKRLGEKSDVENNEDSESEDEDESESIDLRRLVNLGRMYGQLIAEDALSLTSLKVLNFAYLQPKTQTFLEILLATIFKQLSKRSKSADVANSSPDPGALDTAILKLIMKAKETPQVVSGLQYFLTKHFDPAEIASNSSERKVLKRAARSAKQVLTQLSASMS